MKVVVYCDDCHEKKLLGSCIVAYSIQRNGNLPMDTTYILYTNNPDEARKKQPLINRIYDEVKKPPIGSIWESVPEWHHDKHNKRGRETWNKFFCWLYTPCDGESVAVVDYDIICTGSIREAIPPKGKLFSGRRSYNPQTKKLNAGCNGGFYIKNSDFDSSGIIDILKQPLYNKEAYEKVEEIWCYTDEMGVAWYFYSQGDSVFYNLENKFNMPVQRQIKSRKSITQTDTRLLHFMHGTKPWNGRPKNLQRFHKEFDMLWNRMKADCTYDRKKIAIYKPDEPIKVWQYWSGERSPAVLRLEKTIETAYSTDKGYEYHRLNNDDIPDEIKQLQKTCRVENISDVLRYWLLWQYGGVWFDSDIAVRDTINFREFLKYPDIAIASNMRKNILFASTCILACNKGCNVFKEMYKSSLNDLKKYGSNIKYADVGPKLSNITMGIHRRDFVTLNELGEKPQYPCEEYGVYEQYTDMFKYGDKVYGNGWKYAHFCGARVRWWNSVNMAEGNVMGDTVARCERDLGYTYER